MQNKVTANHFLVAIFCFQNGSGEGIFMPIFQINIHGKIPVNSQRQLQRKWLNSKTILATVAMEVSSGMQEGNQS